MTKHNMTNQAKFLMSLTALFALTASMAVASGAGTSGGQFLRVGVGARAAGMAGALSPIVDDPTAIYWNPAGLAMLEKREVSLSYNAYFVDTAQQFLGYGHPSKYGTFGVGITMLSVGSIEKRSAASGDADVPDGGEFNTQDMAGALAWANKFDLNAFAMHYGAALKFVSSDLDAASASTFAADLGVIAAHKASNLSFSLAVLNLGGELKFVDEGDPLPLNIKPGVGYRRDLGKMGKLNLALDADILVNDGLTYVQPGVEWWFHKNFAFRTGWQLGRDSDAGVGFAAGLGMRKDAIGLDYAFVPFGGLGDTHRVSLAYRF
ncbi:MAG: PorV/PorQ family protein [Elusimicrobiota bacterium]